MELVAGTSTSGFSGDGGTATAAQMKSVLIWVDSNGNIYSPEYDNYRIRKISSTGIITTFGGTGSSASTGISGPIGSASFVSPFSIVGDTAGAFFYLCDLLYIWKYVFSTNIITVIAQSTMLAAGFSGDNGPASSAQLKTPTGLWLTTGGILYIADMDNHRVRMISLTGIITSVAGSGCSNGCTGSFGGDGFAATLATLNQPRTVYMDTTGRLFIADMTNSRIRVVNTNNIISTFAGTGTQNPLVDEVAATLANLYTPTDVKGDSLGNIYIADRCVVSRVDTSGIMTIIFGSISSCGFTPGISPRTSPIKNPQSLWIDSLSRVYFSDFNSIHRSIIVSSPTSQPTGQPSRQPSGQPSTQPTNQPITRPSSQPTRQPTGQPSSQPSRQPTAQPIILPTGQPTNQPTSRPSRDLSISPNLFMELLAGTSTAGFGGDGGPATAAQIKSLFFWVDSNRNIYTSDHDNYRIRKISSSGIITTFGGTGNQGISGISGPISTSSFNVPFAIVGDTAGTFFYFCDRLFIWKYVFASNIISVFAQSTSLPAGFSGENGQASSAQMKNPIGLWLTTGGVVYIADTDNHRIRMVTTNGIITTLAGSGCSVGCTGSFAGDGFAATLANLNQPFAVYVDTTGRVFIADTVNNRVRVVATNNNIISTFAGTGTANPLIDDIPSTSSNLAEPRDVKGDSVGNIYITDYVHCTIRRVDPNGIITTLFGGTCGFSSGITSRNSPINRPQGLWVDSLSRVYFSDYNSIHRSFVVNSPTSQPSGEPSRDPTGQPTRQPSSQPSCRPLAQPSRQPTAQPITCPTAQPSSQPTRQPSGQPSRQPTVQPISCPTGQPTSRPTRVVDISPNLFMKLVAGTSTTGFSGDGGPATTAEIYGISPWVDSSGIVYIPDYTNHRIRKVALNGIITTFGGTGNSSTAGISGPIDSTGFLQPFSIVGDTGGTLFYLSDKRYVWKYTFATNIITVVAHSTSLGSGFGGDNGPATLAQLYYPSALWLTTSGVLFICDFSNNRIRKIPLNGIITTVAGSGGSGPGSGGFSGDNGLATTALLSGPTGVYVDSLGRIFIADQGNHRIRLVDTSNIITSFAGTGIDNPFNGENIPATAANLRQCYDVKGDSQGNIYIADRGHCVIRMVDTNGIIATLFGTPSSCGFTLGLSDRSSPLGPLQGICLDSNANIYFTDINSVHRSVLVSSPSSQPSGQPSRQPTGQPSSQPTSRPTKNTQISPNLFMQLVAGRNISGFSGDGGQATSALIMSPLPWVDTAGNIYSPDYDSRRIRRISPTGIITTFGGSGNQSIAGSGGAIGFTSFLNPYSIVGDTAGTFLYFCDRWYIWKYMFSTGIITAVVQSNTLPAGYSGDNGPASSARLISPAGLWLTTAGVLYIADPGNHRIRMVSTSNIITTVAGTGVNSFSGDGLAATVANVNQPYGVYMDTMGRLFIADTINHRIRVVNTNGIIATFAGTGTPNPLVNDIRATLSNLHTPPDVKGDTAGNIYIADYYHCAIRRVDLNGIITTIFGGSCGFSPGISSRTGPINTPQGIWVDSLSRVYFSDFNSIHRGVMVSSPTSQPTGQPTRQPSRQPSSRPSAQPSCQPSTQPIGSPTGQPTNQPITCPTSQPSSQPTRQPSGQPSRQPTRQPISCPTGQPTSVPSRVVDISPNLFMKLIAGTSTAGFSGDGGQATSAQITAVSGWVDSNGLIYVAEYPNYRIRKVAVNGIISTFGGTGNSSAAGIGGPIGSTSFYKPFDIVGDSAGTAIYMSDQFYVWKYTVATNIITVVAQSTSLGAGFSGDNGPATSAQLRHPSGLWLTTSGVLFICDFFNNRIRKMPTSGIIVINTVAGSGGTGPGTDGFSGDNGLATSAALATPTGVYVDSLGRIFIADYGNDRIRLVDTNNIITTFAGTGTENPFNGDNIPATAANLKQPYEVKGDSLGNIYIAVRGHCVVRRVDPSGIIATLFGTPGSCGFTPGLSDRSLSIGLVLGIWLDSNANIYFSDTNSIHRSVLVSSPSSQPSGQPSLQPTGQPTRPPSRQPSCRPSAQPSRQPTAQPITCPTAQPSSQPTRQPSGQPSRQPTVQPISCPTGQPTSVPSRVVDISPNLFMKLVAGTSTPGFAGDQGPATSAQITAVSGWVHSSGNIYIPDSNNNRIRKVAVNGIITTFGGIGNVTVSGISGPIGSTGFYVPFSIVGDAAGTMFYMSDKKYIWKYIFATNIITVVAQSTTIGAGFSGDSGPASSARLNFPCGLWLTSSEELFVVDQRNHRVRKISSTGIITTVAGSTSTGSYSGDGGAATAAALSSPTFVYVDPSGKLFVADQGNNRIRLVDTNNIITTFAGTGTADPFNGDNIPATASNLNQPYDVKGDSVGNIYITDRVNCVVRKVDTNGIIVTLFGTPGSCGFTSGLSDRSSVLNALLGIWLDSSANIYFTDVNSIHRSVLVSSPSSQPSSQPTSRPTKNTQISPNLFMQLVAGTNSSGFSGDGGQATAGQLKSLYLWVDSSGNVYSPDYDHYRVRKISSTGIITTFGGTGIKSNSGITGPVVSTAFWTPVTMVGDTAGSFFYLCDRIYIWKYLFSTGIVTVVAQSTSLSSGFAGDNGPASSAQFYSPTGLWLTTEGILYIADTSNHRIRMLSLTGIITTVAGSGCANGCAGGFGGDGLAATLANLKQPLNLYIDSVGRMFIADSINHRIRLVNTNNIITTFAGTGSQNPLVDDIPATLSNLNTPADVKGDTLGNIYIADYQHCAIRRVDIYGIITTIFGSVSSCGFTPGISSRFAPINTPQGLWVDSASRVYFSDLNSIHRGVMVSSPTSQPTGQPSSSPTRVVNVSPNLFMKLVGGSSTQGFTGDNGPATLASMRAFIPWVDSSGNVYLPDYTNYRIRKIDSTGIITTFGGTGTQSTAGTGGLIGSVSFLNPYSIVGDASGTFLYMSDGLYVWKYLFSSGIVSVYGHAVGLSVGFSGDGGPATSAQLYGARGIWLTTSGVLFITDYGNHRIRRVSSGSPNIITTIAGSGPSGLVDGSFSGDGGAATSATLNYPRSVYVDSNGKIFIADTLNNRIRVVATNTIISTFAGTGIQNPFIGENVPATTANINNPYDVKGDSFGNIYITDSAHQTVKLVDPKGMIVTLFGTPGSSGFSTGVSPRAGFMNSPVGLWVDSGGIIYFTDLNSVHRSIVVSNPTSQPTRQPSSQPTRQPSRQPSQQPTVQPTARPTRQPVGQPSSQPSQQPTSQPIRLPTGQPTNQPVTRPSGEPSGQPTSRPTNVVNISPNLFMKLMGGSSSQGSSGDDGPATSAFLKSYIPWVDSSGNIYLPDNTNSKIRKIDSSTGIITKFGGTGTASPAGLSGPIDSTQLLNPYSIIGDVSGSVLYISDTLFIWKYLFSSDIVSVFAHTVGVVAGFSGDGGPATAAQLRNPAGLWLTTSGALLFADYGNHRTRMISSGNPSIITTVVGSGAGGGVGSFSGDSGPATSATLYNPRSVYVNTNGKLFICDTNNNRIRVVDSNNIITTFAGTGVQSPFIGENLPATLANINTPYDVKGDSLGNIYIADSGNRIIRLVDTHGTIGTLFGTPGLDGFSAGVSPRSAAMSPPVGLWLDSFGTVYFTDLNSVHRGMVVSNPTSQPSGEPSRQPTRQPTARPSRQPSSCPSSQPTSRPTKNTAISTNLYMELVAGTSAAGYTGVGGQKATNAQIKAIHLWVDSVGNIYNPEFDNYRIRKIDSSGIITAFGGIGSQSSTGSSGPIGTTGFWIPDSIVGDTAGTFLYVCDRRFVWKYVFSTDIISVVVQSSPLQPGFSGDNGPASSAQLKLPGGLWLTTEGVLYIADTDNHRIRKVSAGGIITTVAGSGCSNGCTGSFAGDGFAATSANLDRPYAVYVDTTGKFFIPDSNNNRIRVVNTNNIISTFAGTGTVNSLTDNVPASSSSLNLPVDVKGDTAGNIYISDYSHCAIRRVDIYGIITTIFGSVLSCGFSSGVSSRNSAINGPQGLWVDSLSRVYFSDFNSIHRSVDLSPSSQPTGQPSRQPTRQPTARPTRQPSSQPSQQPTSQPTKNTAITTNLYMELLAGMSSAGSTGSGGQATAALIKAVHFWVDSVGNIYNPEDNNYRIRKIASNGIITDFGGTGSQSSAGTAGPIGTTGFWSPASIVGDTAGTFFYLCDHFYVWKYVFSTDIISVVVQSPPLQPGFSGDEGPASSAQLKAPAGLWLTTKGVLYIADDGNHRIRKVSSGGIISTAAGSGCSNGCSGGFAGDGFAATLANLDRPIGVYMDSMGKLFIADFNNNRIRLVDANNIISTFAGTGTQDPFIDGIPATTANLKNPLNVKGDSAGNIYIADYQHCAIRRVDIYGIITTMFGKTPACGFFAGISPRASPIYGPQGLWVDSLSRVYFSDYNSIHRSILISSPSSQPSGQPSRQPTSHPTTNNEISPNLFMQLVAGTDTQGFAGDAGQATQAQMKSLYLWVDTAGNIFSPDYTNFRIRKISTSGLITTIGGTSTTGTTGTPGSIGTRAFNTPFAIVGDTAGTFFYLCDRRYIWKYVFSTDIITVVAQSTSLQPGFAGDNGPASSAQLQGPSGMWLTTSGFLYIADKDNHRIRMITPSGIITTVAGSGGPGTFGGDGLAATLANLNQPLAVYVDTVGRLFISDYLNARIRVMDNTINGIITTFAGTGILDPFADNIPATTANINPRDVKGDTVGNIFFPDFSHYVVRRVDSYGIITTIFGSPNSAGFSPGISSRNAQINSPQGLWIDSQSRIYLSDTNSIHRGSLVSSPSSQPSGQPSRLPSAQPSSHPTMTVQPLSPNLFMEVIAGLNTNGFSGDNGPATSAQLRATASWLDSLGNLFIADGANHRIRRVARFSGIITTFGGTGNQSTAGTSGPIGSVGFNSIMSIVGNTIGTVMIFSDQRFVWAYNFFTNMVNVAVGSTSLPEGFSGDGGASHLAQLDTPLGLWITTESVLYIADYKNHRIRKSAGNIITTVAGSGGSGPGFGGDTGDGGSATSAALNFPAGVYLDTSGNMFIADYGNNKIRFINAGTNIISTLAGTGTGTFYNGNNIPATTANLNGPRDVKGDSLGNLYVADSGNCIIRRIDNRGILFTVFGVPESCGFSAGGGGGTFPLEVEVGGGRSGILIVSGWTVVVGRSIQ
jgi:sugar lactone lactonase YvrE